MIDLDSRLIGEGAEGHGYQDGGEERSHGSLPLQSQDQCATVNL